MARNPAMAYVTFECTPEFKGRLEALAKKELRSVSSQIRIMLSDWLAERTKEPSAPRRGVHLSGVPLPPSVGVYQEPEKPRTQKERADERPSRGRRTERE